MEIMKKLHHFAWVANKVYMVMIVVLTITGITVSYRFPEKTINESISENVVIVYSNSDNILSWKKPKAIATVVTPRTEADIYVVYPETTTHKVETTPNFLLTYFDSNVYNDIDCNTTPELVETTENVPPANFTKIESPKTIHSTEPTTLQFLFTTYSNFKNRNWVKETININQTKTAVINSKESDAQIIEKSSQQFKNIQNESISIVTEATTFVNKDLQSKEKNFENSYDITTVLNNFPVVTELVNQKTTQNKENEIGFQSNENRVTTVNAIKRKIKIKKNIDLIYENVTESKKIIHKTPFVSTSPQNIYDKPNFEMERMNETELNYNIDIENSQISNATHKRDSLLKQSFKSKKFISAFMGRNKNKLPSTISSKISSETATITNKIPNQTTNATIRRIHNPKKTTLSLRRFFKSSTISTTPSSLKNAVTLIPDEIFDPYLVTEWRSMKINKSKIINNKNRYRGRKRFSLAIL